jgi:hypothetical protein
MLSQIVTDGDGRWVKKSDLTKASASADGLMSKEDFSKLAGIEAGAEENVIETVKVNGTALTPDANKAVDVSVPILGVSKNGTALTPDSTTKVVDVTVPTKVSDLSNDSGFQTASDVSTAISTAVAGITQFNYEVVQTLPASGTKGTIYLVSNSGTGTNIYDEYIWLAGDPAGHFELLGTTEMDLSGYVQATEMTTIANADIISAVNSAFGVPG